MMKFFGILVISMVAHVANGAGVKLNVENANSHSNKWISIDMDNGGRIGRTRVQQPITDAENWKIAYVIETNTEEIEGESTSLCNAEPSSQGANVVDLFVKALGVAENACPIQTQTVDKPSSVIEGELELDGYDSGTKIFVTLSLMIEDQDVARITFNGRIKKN